VSQRENVAVTNDADSGRLPAQGSDAGATGLPVGPTADRADDWGAEQDAGGADMEGGADLAEADALAAAAVDTDADDMTDDAEVVDTDAEDVDTESADDVDTESADDTEAPRRDVADLEQESEIAADYVEGLLDVADLDGDIDMDVEGDRALVSVVGATLQELVGPRGEVLEALQELTRLAVHRQTGTRTRIMLDVGGYRARRRMELTAVGRDAAEDVSRTGVARRLDPMTPFERKIVHDAVAAAGLRSESEGEEPHRRVVVLPAG
jgi:spoIIIJ-associated protein